MSSRRDSRVGYHRTQFLPGSSRARKGQHALSAPILLESGNSGLTWIKQAMRASRRSMSSEHQRLQRQDNRLQTKDQRVNEGYRIDDVQIDKIQRADILRLKQLMVV